MLTDHRRSTLGALLIVWACAGQAQTVSEPVVTKRALELREAPGDTSPSVLRVPAQTSLTRGSQRQGPWVSVSTSDGKSGWVHMFDVASPNQPSSGGSAGGALRGLTSLFGRSAAPAPSTSTSTVGIRGLSAEDINNAQPNLAAVAQMEALRATPEVAQRFAASAGVQARDIALQQPASSAGGASTSGGAPPASTESPMERFRN